MKSFLNLVSIENFKMWKRLSTKVMLIVLAGLILLGLSIMKYYNVSQNVPTETKVSATWKEEAQSQVDSLKLQLAEQEKQTNKLMRLGIGSTEKTIAEQEYAIAHDIKPASKESIWSTISTVEANAGFGTLIALLLIIACSANVAGEFSEGTMKMMIPRPYSRSQILTAKFITALGYGLLLLAVTIVLNFLLLGVFYGFNNLGAMDMLWTGSKIIYIPAAIKTLVIFGLEFLQVLFYVIFAFALSAMFRSRSIATGFALFTLIAGVGIMNALAMYFTWGKFLPFGMTKFSSFITAGITIQGTSLGFALIMSAIYAILFLLAGYYTFNKRDIQ